MITSLKSNQIIVIGTNLKGNHIGGAAKYAHEHFGAIWGQGEGLQGQSYAFPTLDEKLQQLSHERLIEARDKLYMACNEHKDKVFLMTPVGTGIAGYSVEYMKLLFTNPPSNLTLPKDFIS